MNIIRELRKIKNRSILSKIRLILLLILLLTISTYSWFSVQRNIGLNELKGKTYSWDVVYKINDNSLNEETEFTFLVDEFYPGVSDTKIVDIYNVGKNPSKISIDLLEVTMFGETMYYTDEDGNVDNTKYLAIESNDALEYQNDNKILNLFGNSTYPFEIGYILSNDVLTGQYIETESGPATAKAQLSVSLNWTYEGSKDEADTTIGRNAYSYYKNVNSTANITASEITEKLQQGLRIKLRIKSVPLESITNE